MATASHNHLHSYFNAAEHPVFMRAFDATTRNELLSEDLTAGRSITSILTAIVTLGLLIGILALVVVLW